MHIVIWVLTPVWIGWAAYTAHQLRRAYRDPRSELDHLWRAINASLGIAVVNMVVVLGVHLWRMAA